MNTLTTAVFETVEIGGRSVKRSVPAKHGFAYPLVFVDESENGVHSFRRVMLTLSSVGFECYEVGGKDASAFLKNYGQRVILVSLYARGIPLAETVRTNRNVRGYVCIYQTMTASEMAANHLEFIVLEIADQCPSCPTRLIPSGSTDLLILDWLKRRFPKEFLPD
ncbi:MAG: hypothetical protein ABSF56_02510 [Minisyncoccia bacterium]|jgi:hypothetical protein